MRINKKLAVITATAGILALGAGTAVAYWTTGGEGVRHRHGRQHRR